MDKKLLLYFMVCSFLMASCKKEDTSPSSTFSISGVHSMDLSLLGDNVLDLSVVQSSGVPEPVTITVSGLPEGVTAKVTPGSKMTNYTAVLSFDLLGHAFPGTYTIKVVGNSSSYSRSYEMNIAVPPYNGFSVGATYFRTSAVRRETNKKEIHFVSSDNRGAVLECFLSEYIPSESGTYTYKIGHSEVNTKTMSVAVSGIAPGKYWSKGTTDIIATVKVSASKVSVSIPEIRLYSDGGTYYADVCASASE